MMRGKAFALKTIARCAAVSAVIPFVANADVTTNIWQGADGAAWGTAANWSENHVPDGTEYVIFPDKGVSYSVNVDGEETVHRTYSRILPIDAEQRLFVRGLEFTAYSPCIQTHGYVRHPFEFDNQTRGLYVEYAARHRALAGEIAAASRKAAQTGVPVVRPLVWDYQDDANTWDIADEYLFCDRYLVAPVLADVTARDAYLPKGVWREEVTGVRHVVSAGGKRLKVDVPIGRIAVFVKE